MNYCDSLIYLTISIPKISYVRRSVLFRFRFQPFFMADHLQEAIRAMSIEDDEPLTLPDIPRFRVFDENATSVLGKLLHHDCQIMAKMIEAMSSVWRMIGRVHAPYA